MPDRLRAATWAHWATLVASAAVLVRVNRSNWFLHDEWAFVVDRALVGGPGLRGLWDPHNEHWSTVATVVYRALVDLFGVDSYWPFLAVAIAVHLALAHLLWRVIRRVVGDPWVATAGATVVLFLGTGAEDLTRAFQMTLLGSVAAGLAWLLVMPPGPRFERRDVAGWALGVLALACSGVGIAMVGVATLYALARRGWRAALVVVAVPAGAYLVWLALYGRRALGNGGQPLRQGLQDVPAYLWQGLTGSLDATLGLGGAGTVVVLATAVWAVRRARPLEPAWALALACAAGAVAQLAFTAIRRSHLGIGTADDSRYAYLTIVLVLPLLCLLVDRVVPHRRHLVALAAGTALVLVVQLPLLADFARAWSAVAQDQRLVLLAAVDVARSGEELVADTPFPSYAPDVQVQDLLELVDDGHLTPADEVDAAARLTAQTFLQISAAPAAAPARPDPGGPRVEATSGVAAAPGQVGPGCARWVPTAPVAVVRLGVRGPATLTVTTEQAGVVTAAYLSPDAAVAATRARELPTQAGAPLEVRSTASGVDLQLGLPAAGTTTVCGLDPAGTTPP